MAITTYITAVEATLFYSDSQYDSNSKTQALELSFGLLNGYLNSALQIPIVPEWNGSDASLESPAVLKIAQGKFYEYLLRRGAVGDTPSVVEVFDAAVLFAQSITQEQLTVPEAQTFPREAGWHIVSKSNTGGGDVFIRSIAPTYTEGLKMVITNAASASYPGTFTYSLYAPARSASTVSTGNATATTWLNVTGPDGNTVFEIRWIGKWTNADYVEFYGVAEEQVDSPAPQRNTIQQSTAAY